MTLVGYLAPVGYEEALKSELKEVAFRHGRLFFARGPKQKVHWVQNIWHNPQTFSFRSVSEGATFLRSLGSLWSYYPVDFLRRAALIASRLPFFSPKPIRFPSLPPTVPLGSWTLLDPNTLVASPHCSSSFSNGELNFVETDAPPSRAYLKLWEFFTRFGVLPRAGERCLEIGASPGSWTWVLQQMGAEVAAIDRAPLAPAVAALKRVTFLKKDAFSLRPEDFPDVDWVFSDVVCYPKKLLDWLYLWLERDVSLVCTLKFQGENNGDAILEEFEKIEGSGLIHLFHNKHELTWHRLK